MDEFKVVLLGIIFNPETREILLAKREDDEYIPEISWSFPSTGLTYDSNMEHKFAQRIKEKTGLDIENMGTVFSTKSENKEDMLGVYFLAEVIGGKLASDKGEFSELKWVKPNEVEEHFTTPIHSRVKEYLNNLK